jgi:hypothetical protein
VYAHQRPALGGSGVDAHGQLPVDLEGDVVVPDRPAGSKPLGAVDGIQQPAAPPGPECAGLLGQHCIIRPV